MATGVRQADWTIPSTPAQSAGRLSLRRLRTGWRLGLGLPPPPTSRNIALTRSRRRCHQSGERRRSRDGTVSSSRRRQSAVVKCSPVRSNELLPAPSTCDLGRRGRRQAAPTARKPRSKSSSSGEAERSSVRRTVNVGSAGSRMVPGFSKKIAHGNASTRRSEEPSHVINAAVGGGQHRLKQNTATAAGRCVENAELSADVVRQAPPRSVRRVSKPQQSGVRDAFPRAAPGARPKLAEALESATRAEHMRDAAVGVVGIHPCRWSAASRGVETRTIAFELRSAGYRRSQRRRNARQHRAMPGRRAAGAFAHQQSSGAAPRDGCFA